MMAHGSLINEIFLAEFQKIRESSLVAKILHTESYESVSYHKDGKEIHKIPRYKKKSLVAIY